MSETIYYVEWIDPTMGHGGSAWQKIDEVMEYVPAVCRSVGVIHKETDEFYILVSHWGGDNSSVAGVLVLPKACVRTMTPLVAVNGVEAFDYVQGEIIEVSL